MAITITFSGTPVGKQRPRVYNGHGVTPTKTRQFEAMLKQCYSNQAQGEHFPKGTALHVNLDFRYPIPKSWSHKKQRWAKIGIIHPCVKPDLDNCIKMLDALNGLAWDDDNQIVSIYATKCYSDNPGGTITISELKELNDE